MSNNLKFYIDGAWVDPITPHVLGVINLSNERVFAHISLGAKADVDLAVAAAKRAFKTFSQTSRAERLELLKRIVTGYKKRSGDLARAVSDEMGAPRDFALDSQVDIGLKHLEKMIEVLQTYSFETLKGRSLVVREPVGVVGLITP